MSTDSTGLSYYPTNFNDAEPPPGGPPEPGVAANHQLHSAIYRVSECSFKEDIVRFIPMYGEPKYSVSGTFDNLQGDWKIVKDCIVRVSHAKIT